MTWFKNYWDIILIFVVLFVGAGSILSINNITIMLGCLAIFIFLWLIFSYWIFSVAMNPKIIKRDYPNPKNHDEAILGLISVAKFRRNLNEKDLNFIMVCISKLKIDNEKWVKKKN